MSTHDNLNGMAEESNYRAIFNSWVERMTGRIDTVYDSGGINVKDHRSLIESLNEIRVALENGASYEAVFLTHIFWGEVRRSDWPALEKALRSESASYAAKAKTKMQPARAKELVDAKRAANPSLSVKEACRQVAKKHLGSARSWNAVKRSYDKA